MNDNMKGRSDVKENTLVKQVGRQAIVAQKRDKRWSGDKKSHRYLSLALV